MPNNIYSLLLILLGVTEIVLGVAFAPVQSGFFLLCDLGLIFVGTNTFLIGFTSRNWKLER